MIVIDWLLFATLAAAIVAVADAVVRLRSHRGNSLLAIAELVVGALLFISAFGPVQQFISVSFGSGILAIILEVVLILLLVLRGGTRRSGGAALTLIALVLNTVVVVVALIRL